MSLAALEKSIKSIETGLKVVEAAAKSVLNNQQNVKDAENKAPGAGTVRHRADPGAC
jgi:hypothetical protein